MKPALSIPSATHAERAGHSGVFLTTRWSRVVLAGEHPEGDGKTALAELCRDYWRPLYHFARRSDFGPEDAEDLTQGFIAGLLESQSIGRADPERGRFRTFLLSSFGHYMMNFRRDRKALKRGGGVQAVVPVDAAGAEAELETAAPDWMTPERYYEQRWAMALLEKVMTRLREEYAKAGRMTLFEALQPHLSGAAGRPGYAKLGEELRMSESAVTVTVHRMRKRYGVLLREEIAATVAVPEDVDDELRHLMQVVSGGSEPQAPV